MILRVLSQTKTAHLCYRTKVLAVTAATLIHITSGHYTNSLTFATHPSSRPQHSIISRSSLSSTSTSSDNLHPSQTKMTCEVVQLPCLSDNYGFLIHSPSTGETAVVDTPEAKPYLSELSKRGWTLTHILNTHHHFDHTQGNPALKATGDVKVIGPIVEKHKIPGIDTAVGGGDSFEFGGMKVEVIDVGGHTLGHIAYYFPDEKMVFCGDALFPLGCGRMFEGTPEQFWPSLLRLRELPDDTLVYSAHEYTQSNARFAMSVEPGNELLVKRNEEINQKRAKGIPTVPSLMGEEKMTNPFLRCDGSEEIQSNVGAGKDEPDHLIFAKVRKAKDNF